MDSQVTTETLDESALNSISPKDWIYKNIVQQA
jgi:hypothetical protein